MEENKFGLFIVVMPSGSKEKHCYTVIINVVYDPSIFVLLPHC